MTRGARIRLRPSVGVILQQGSAVAEMLCRESTESKSKREQEREREGVGVEALREEGRMPYTMDTMDRQTDEKSNSFTN